MPRTTLCGVAVLLIGPALSVGCSDDSSFTIGMTEAAMRALPSISSTSSTARAGAPGDDITDFYITNFFKFECHHSQFGVNYCPEGTVPDTSNKFTATTMIGLILHAEALSNEVFRSSYTSCGTGEEARALAVSSSSFVSNDGGDASKYLVDFFGLLGCVGYFTTPARHNFTYSPATDRFVVLRTRKHDLESPGWDQTDIHQSYFALTPAGTNRLLAFNMAGINDTGGVNNWGSRVLLIVNIETRRFLVRQRDGANYVTAAGQAGFDVNGVPQIGTYFVKTPNTPDGVCVDNTTSKEVDASECSTETAAWSGADDVVAYLEITSAEQADLAAFLAYFVDGATATNLTESEAPGSPADAIHFPDVIE